MRDTAGMKGTAQIRLYMIAAACICAISARASVFYVAPDGSDAADGTSLETAWQTLPFAVHQITGGDTLYVRGGVYRGRTVFTNNSGSVEAPIRIYAYSNEVPVLKGSEIVEGWEPFTNSIWRVTNWTHRSQQVFADEVLLQQIGWPNDFNRDRACSCSSWLYIPHGYSCADIDPVTYTLNMGDPLTNMVPGSFYYCPTSQVLYVWLSGGQSPSGSLMEVSKESGIFYDWSNNGYLHVRGLSFRHSSTLTTASSGWPGVWAGYNGLIEDCDIEWCDGSGLGMRNNSTVLNCRINNNGIQGIHANTHTNLSVIGCTIMSNNYRNYTLNHAAGIKFISKVSDTRIVSNEVAHNWGPGIWFDTCPSNSGNIVAANYVHDNMPFPNRPGDTMSYSSSGIFIEKTGGAQVYNNLVVSNSTSGIYLSGSSDCRVYNNYVAGTRGTPGGHRGLAGISMKNPQGVGVAVKDNQLFNNIISDNLCDADLHLTDPNFINVERNYSDYNCIYRTQGAGIVFPSSHLSLRTDPIKTDDLTVWAALTGWDTNSMNVPPLCDPNVGLATNSPCVDAGVSPDALAQYQRFAFGPMDGDGDGRAATDIGPCELQASSGGTVYADALSTNAVFPFTNWNTAAAGLAEAVAAASDGGLVLLREGEYLLSEQVMITNAITVRSAGCPADTRLIATGSDRCLMVTSPHALIDGLSIEEGSADYGGGVYMAAGRIQNCLVLSNYTSAAGGGIYCASGAVVRNTTVAGNASASDGGGLYLEEGAAALDCAVLQNGASSAGGGLYLEAGALVFGCLVENNSSGDGGGLYMAASSTVTRCTLRNNTASGKGGGAYCATGGLVSLSYVDGNRAASGGGLYSAASGLFSGCVVISNAAAVAAGGVWMGSGGEVLHLTIAENAASNSAGGLLLDGNADVTASILYNNRAPVSSNHVLSGGSMTYSCASPLAPGSGNIDADPLFQQGFRLKYESPCVDGAPDAGAGDLDIDQNPRYVDGDGDGVADADMGAYEYRNILYVDASSTNPVVPYRTRDTAAARIGDALLVSWHGDVIVVATGTYAITAQLLVNKGVSIYGEGRPDECVVQGNGATRGWVLNHTNALIRGFTITNCAADSGGGVYIKDAGTVQNCRITGNRSTNNLGGAFQYFFGTFPVYCSAAYDSYVHEGGGGVVIARGGTLENCLIDNNEAAYAGGVLCLDGGVLKNCTISSNSAAQRGGGMIIQNTGTVQNTIIYFNNAPDGSNVYNSGSSYSYAYSCAAPLVAGSGNTAADPLFISAADFRLQESSICIDAGDNGVTVYPLDLEGIPRRLDGDADGLAVVDMGAYEHVHGTNDTDADGLTDILELQHGTDIFNRDTDDDGMSDGDEVFAGTSPTDADSVFSMSMESHAEPDKMLIHWWSASNRTYDLMQSTNLAEGFSAHAPGLSATPPMNVYTDSITVDMKLYRVNVRE